MQPSLHGYSIEVKFISKTYVGITQAAEPAVSTRAKGWCIHATAVKHTLTSGSSVGAAKTKLCCAVSGSTYMHVMCKQRERL